MPDLPYILLQFILTQSKSNQIVMSALIIPVEAIKINSNLQINPPLDFNWRRTSFSIDSVDGKKLDQP
jgi:hypothetical protein